MKKKLLLGLLSGILLLGSTGCGVTNPREKKATIIDNEKSTIKLSANELYNISEENEAKFKKYYIGSKVIFEGTISSVETSTSSCYMNTLFEQDQSKLKMSGISYADSTPCATINFEEGFKLLIPSIGVLDLADLNVGDKYNVEANIIYMWNKQVEICGMDEGGAVNFANVKINLAKK